MAMRIPVAVLILSAAICAAPAVAQLAPAQPTQPAQPGSPPQPERPGQPAQPGGAPGPEQPPRPEQRAQGATAFLPEKGDEVLLARSGRPPLSFELFFDTYGVASPATGQTDDFLGGGIEGTGIRRAAPQGAPFLGGSQEGTGIRRMNPQQQAGSQPAGSGASFDSPKLDADSGLEIRRGAAAPVANGPAAAIGEGSGDMIARRKPPRNRSAARRKRKTAP